MIKKLSLVFLVLLSACEGGSGARDPNPLHLPPEGFVGDSVKGENLYNQNCLTCHGINGLGTNQGPSFVEKTYEPRRHADLAFHLAVKNGVRAHHWNFGGMKHLENLSPEDVGHIVQYLRAIQRNAGIE